MIKVYIARHGETGWNAEGRIQGRSDPDLNARGHEQSLKLRDQLKDRPLRAIYSSTRRRAIQTAEPIARYLGLPIQQQPELDEMDFGLWEGRKRIDFSEEELQEFERYRKDRLHYRVPCGENYADVAARVRPFVMRLLTVHQGDEILVVGHRGSNRMLVGLLLELGLEKAVRIEQPNDCIYVIERNDEKKIGYLRNGLFTEGLIFENL